MLNEKNLAIVALVILALAEFGHSYVTGQATQNIGVIVTGLVAMIGNTVVGNK